MALFELALGFVGFVTLSMETRYLYGNHVLYGNYDFVWKCLYGN